MFHISDSDYIEANILRMVSECEILVKTKYVLYITTV
jgi:hypothetical protein